MFPELAFWGEGIALSFAHYVSFGAVVVFVNWGLGAVWYFLQCHTVARMAGFVVDEGGTERPWLREYSQIHVVFISNVFLAF